MMRKKQPRNLRLENLENRWVYAAGLGCDGHHEDPLLDQEDALIAEGEGPADGDSLASHAVSNHLKVTTDLRDGELVVQVEVVRPRPVGTSLRGEGEFAPIQRPESIQPQVRSEASIIRTGQSNQTNASRSGTDVTKVSGNVINLGNLNPAIGSNSGTANFLHENPLDAVNSPRHPVEPFRSTVENAGSLDTNATLRPAPSQTQAGFVSFRDELFFRSVQSGLTSANDGRSHTSSLTARPWSDSGSINASELATNSTDTMSVRTTEVIFGNQQSGADLQNLDALLNDLAREHWKNQGEGRVESVQAGQGAPATIAYSSVDPTVVEGGMIALTMERGEAITTLLADNTDEGSENRIWVTNVGIYREIDFLSPGNADASLAAAQSKEGTLGDRTSEDDSTKRVNPLFASGTALVSLLYFGLRRNRKRTKLNAAQQSALNA